MNVIFSTFVSNKRKNEKKVRIKAKKKRREESKKENKQIKTGREITRLITACTKEKEKRKAHIVDRDRE